MKRWAVLAFGWSAYLAFVGVFLYAVAFVGHINLGFLPTSLDGAAELPLGQALAIDLLLLGLFAAQHSVMARPWFKQWWTQFVPEPIERSTYVLCANLVFVLLFWQWQPIAGTVWDVQAPAARAALYVLFACGWLIVLVTTFLINHFDLFGLRQVWLYFRGRPYRPLGFMAPGPYKLVRHPMYIGWLMAFWAIPTMTVAHFACACAVTAYILTAIYFEERDLLRFLGPAYREYRRSVPMLIPRVLSRGRPAESPAADAVSVRHRGAEPASSITTTLSMK